MQEKVNSAKTTQIKNLNKREKGGENFHCWQANSTISIAQLKNLEILFSRFPFHYPDTVNEKS